MVRKLELDFQRNNYFKLKNIVTKLIPIAYMIKNRKQSVTTVLNKYP